MNAYLPHLYPTISHPAPSPLLQRISILFAPKTQHSLSKTESHSPMT